MKVIRSLLLVVLFLAQAGQALPQETDRTPIIYEKKFLGYVFTYGEEVLTPGDLNSVLSQEPKLADTLAAAKWRARTGRVLAVAGIGLGVWGLFGGLAEGEPMDDAMGLTGAGLALLGSGLFSSSTWYYREAVDVYNSDIRQGALPVVGPVRFCMRPNGVALSVRF